MLHAILTAIVPGTTILPFRSVFDPVGPVPRTGAPAVIMDRTITLGR